MTWKKFERRGPRCKTNKKKISPTLWENMPYRYSRRNLCRSRRSRSFRRTRQQRSKKSRFLCQQWVLFTLVSTPKRHYTAEGVRVRRFIFSLPAGLAGCRVDRVNFHVDKFCALSMVGIGVRISRTTQRAPRPKQIAKITKREQ